MEVKEYKQRVVPDDTVWERNSKFPKVLFYKLPSWFRGFIYSLGSLFSWFNIVRKDRNWDYQYIYDVLQHKLEKTRDYIVENNRSTKVQEINRDITICLNLIERVKGEYYECEYLSYTKQFGNKGEFKDFFSSNKLQHRKACEYIIKNKDMYHSPTPDNKQLQAMVLSQLKHKKAKKLLFKIIEEKIDMWWD